MENNLDDIEDITCPLAYANVRIYSLSDRAGNVFYVGCTVSDFEKRLSSHLSEARSSRRYSNKRKSDIIKSLDFDIVGTILEVKWITGERTHEVRKKARLLEKQWIEKFLALGYALVNKQPIGRKYDPKIVRDYTGQAFYTKSK